MQHRLSSGGAGAAASTAIAKPVPVPDQPVLHRTMSQPSTPVAPEADARRKKAKAEQRPAVAPLATGAPARPKAETTVPLTAPEATAPTRTGGVTAPEQEEPVAHSPSTGTPGTTAPPPSDTAAPQNGTAVPQEPASNGSLDSGSQSGTGGDPSAPPSEH